MPIRRYRELKEETMKWPKDEFLLLAVNNGPCAHLPDRPEDR